MKSSRQNTDEADGMDFCRFFSHRDHPGESGLAAETLEIKRENEYSCLVMNRINYPINCHTRESSNPYLYSIYNFHSNKRQKRIKKPLIHGL
ncbi:MAG: hypothetical protein EHM58_06185 [Ignavibacteriae bacterium]|nr:MAG: hypothetical protein EHM58_06185 [Ignavibacteriota bacterium]